MNDPTYFNPQPKGRVDTKVKVPVKAIKANILRGLGRPGLLESRVEELERRVLVLENLTKPNNLTGPPNINDLTPNTAPNKPNIDLTRNLTRKDKVKKYQREYMRRKRVEGVKELIENESIKGKVVGHFV